MQKRPKAIIFLIIVTILSILNNLSSVTSYETMSDYALFKHVGLSDLFFGLFVFILITNIIVLYYFWKPSPRGFQIAIIGQVINIIETIIASVIAFFNLDIAKSSYVISREARGLSQVDDIALDYMFSPWVMPIIMTIYIIWIIFTIYLIKKNKKYFMIEKELEKTE